jgi:hypothetical protein
LRYAIKVCSQRICIIPRQFPNEPNTVFSPSLYSEPNALYFPLIEVMNENKSPHTKESKDGLRL